MAHFVFYARGSYGDVIPMLRLAQRLQIRGHEVHVLSQGLYRSLGESRGLRFEALDDEATGRAYQQAQPLLQRLDTIPDFYRQHLLPPLVDDVRLLGKFSRPETLVVTLGSCDLPARLWRDAHQGRVSWVYMAPGLMGPPEAIEALYGPVLGSDINARRRQIGLPSVSDWTSWVRTDGQVAQWPAWFSTRGAEICTGFFFDDCSAPAPPVEPFDILITAGTGRYFGDHLYRAVLEALQRSNHSVCLVTSHRDLVPATLSDTVRVVDWLPFESCLRQFRCVVHHGGIGITSECLRQGVPQVVLAEGADRPQNALELSRLGVARSVPMGHWNPSDILDALDGTLSSPTMREACREIAVRTAREDGLTLACERLEAQVLAPPNLPAPRSATAAGDSRRLLAELLARKKERPYSVCLQPDGGNLPLVFVAPLQMHCVVYRTLISLLATDRPLYGLHGLERRRPDSSFDWDAAAEGYIEELRLHLPSGPYLLAGWSSGGRIAYAMARQLGGQATYLGLIDAFAPGYPKLASWPGMLSAAVTRLGAMPVAEVMPHLGRKLLTRLRMAQDARIDKPDTSWPGYADFFWAATSEWHTEDKTGGWGSILPGRIRIHEIGGDHTALMQSPNVERLAHALLASLP